MNNITPAQGKYLELSGKEIPSYLTREEVHELLSQIKKPHHHLFINFLWSTGARVSEALAVEVKDIDFKAKHINLLTLKRKKILYRVVPAHDGLLSELAAYLYQKNIREGKIFNFTRQNAWSMIRKYFLKVGITKNPHPHIFRHSFCFNCSEQGLHPRILQRLAGHSTVLSTMLYYNPTEEVVKHEFQQIKF